MSTLLLHRLAALSFLTAVCCAQSPPPLRKFELRSQSKAFWKLVPRDAQLEKIADGFGFTEGPVWDERGFVYVSDEMQNKIYKVYPDGRKEIFADFRDPDGSTFDKDGRFINCASSLRIVVEVMQDGTRKTLADRFEGKKFNSPNDIVPGPDRALYFTDPTLDLPKGETQELPFTGVFRLANDGSLRLLIKEGLVQPNGLAFSPNGKLLYVDDTRTQQIHVYDVGTDGSMSNGRIFAKQEGPPRSGGADGLRVDAKGNLFVTGPEGIWIWDAKGTHLGTIVLPESAANLAWGGRDYKTLYITARGSVYRLKTNTRGFIPWKVWR